MLPLSGSFGCVSVQANSYYTKVVAVSLALQ